MSQMIKSVSAEVTLAGSSASGEALYKALVDSLATHAMFALSADGTIVTWNSGAAKTFGYQENEVIGKPFALLFTPEDARLGAPEMELDSVRTGAEVEFERWHVRKDRSRFWGTNTVAPIYATGGALIGFTKVVADTTEDRRASLALRDNEERLRLLIDSVPEYAIFSLSLDGSINTWNAAAHGTFGYPAAEIVGHDFAQLFGTQDVADGLPAKLLEEAALRGAVAGERWLVRKDGTRFFGRVRLSRLKPGINGASRGFVHIAHDITEQHELSQELRRRASLDQLTELSNRSTFLEHVVRAISAIKRRSTNLFAILFIDLDHFKQVNDTFGHIAADRLLSVTARRLENCVRSEDVVARIGGDEFAILVNGITDIRDAQDAAARVSAEMREPVSIDGKSMRATVSIGIALGSARYNRPEEILHDADVAMYAAKADGRGRSVMFSRQGAADGQAQCESASDVGHAIERNELHVAYQPIVRLSDLSIAGFEALVRWHDPCRGLRKAADFLTKTTDSELLVAIDRWVLRKACRTLAAWQRKYDQPTLSINVNFSSKHVTRSDVFKYVRDTLHETGVAAGCLHLEIAESAIMQRSENATVLLSAIHNLGVELTIDDFGVGFSSLAALGQLPLKALKIDRSFVAAMDAGTGRELVSTITKLAHGLGLRTTAEGIETIEQLRELISIGCTYGQGFFLREPLDADSAERLLVDATVLPRSIALEWAPT